MFIKCSSTFFTFSSIYGKQLGAYCSEGTKGEQWGVVDLHLGQVCDMRPERSNKSIPKIILDCG